MAEGEKNAVERYFDKPTLAKGAPAYAVSLSDLSGWNMNDLVLLLTIVYTLLLIVKTIPSAAAAVQYILSKIHARTRK